MNKLHSLKQDALEKIQTLNLNYLDDNYTSNIVQMAFNSVFNFFNLNFNPFFNFNSINHLIIDIIIGEYLVLIKNSNLQNQLNLDEAIKTISEGDVSVTYFQTQTKEDKIDLLINHFLDKKKELLTFKSITW